MNDFGAVVLIAIGVAFGVLGLIQALTGRYIGFRKLRRNPSREKISLGGWASFGLGVIALLLGVSWLVGGVVAEALGAGGWCVLLLGGLWMTFRLRRLQA